LGQYARNWHGTETTTTPTATTDPYCLENPWDCDGSYSGGSDTSDISGGGGKPIYDLAANNDCANWDVCANNLSPELMQNYWEYNKSYLDVMGRVGDVTAGFGIVSATVGMTTLVSDASIALFLGVVDPEPISKALILGGVAIAVVGFIAVATTNEMQDVNNAIVESGAYNSGGTITASPTSVTITTANGSTKVNTWIPFVAQVTLNLWASGNLVHDH